MESLRNPIAVTAPAPQTESVMQDDLKQQTFENQEADKENISEVEKGEGGEEEEEGHEEMVEENSHDNTRTEAEAVEMQARMEELLKDLGLFRRKVADDHERFGMGRKRPPLGEVRVN